MGDNRRVQGDVMASPIAYIVDDDADLCEEMVFGLATLGVNATAFPDAPSLYRAYAVRPSDVVIIDIGLEGEDGLSIAAHLRATQNVGIVMATARGSVDDRVTGLSVGADAYLVKPIDIRELAATVMAVNQRLGRKRTVAPAPVLRWELLEGGWVLTDGLGHRLRLTTSERHFLERLFRERGKTVGRGALVEAIGADIYDFNYAYLDTIVSRLRRRARKSGMLLPLHAIRGEGFAFTE